MPDHTLPPTEVLLGAATTAHHTDENQTYVITDDPIAPETAHALCMEIIEPYMTALVQTRSMAAEQIAPLDQKDIKQAKALGPHIVRAINQSVLNEPITTPPDKITQPEVTPIASWANRQLEGQKIPAIMQSSIVTKLQDHPDGILGIRDTPSITPRIIVPMSQQTALI